MLCRGGVGCVMEEEPVMEGWGGSYTGVGWGVSCRCGVVCHEGVGWGCLAGVGWVMKRLVGS